MKGILEEIKEVKQMSEGVNKKGERWVLWGTKLRIDGRLFGLADFSRSQLEEKLKSLKEGQTLEFVTEKKGEYENIKKDSPIRILEEAKASARFIEQVDIEQVWKDSADCVVDYLTKKKITVESFGEVSSSVNTIFMDKMREKRRGGC